MIISASSLYHVKAPLTCLEVGELKFPEMCFPIGIDLNTLDRSGAFLGVRRLVSQTDKHTSIHPIRALDTLFREGERGCEPKLNGKGRSWDSLDKCSSVALVFLGIVVRILKLLQTNAIGNDVSLKPGYLVVPHVEVHLTVRVTCMQQQ